MFKVQDFEQSGGLVAEVALKRKRKPTDKVQARQDAQDSQPKVF
jgi:hypothetical protein